MLLALSSLLSLSLSVHVSSYFNPCRKTDAASCWATDFSPVSLGLTSGPPFTSSYNLPLASFATFDDPGATRRNPSSWSIDATAGFPGGAGEPAGQLVERSRIEGGSGNGCSGGREGSHVRMRKVDELSSRQLEIQVAWSFDLGEDDKPQTVGVIFRMRDNNNYFRWDYTHYNDDGNLVRCESLRLRVDGVLQTIISPVCGAVSCTSLDYEPVSEWHQVLISLDVSSTDKVWVARGTPAEGTYARSQPPHIRLRTSTAGAADWLSYFEDPLWNNVALFCAGAACKFDNFGAWTYAARYVARTIDFPRCSSCTSPQTVIASGGSDTWCRCCFYDCETKDREQYCNVNPLNTNPASPFCLGTPRDLCDGVKDPTSTFRDYTDTWCENCYDGLLNQDESGYPDCNGKCGPCTCSDGVRNGGELEDAAGGVDCGGPDCASCSARCSNGRKDGDETGVDCGGANCGPCPTCFDGLVNQGEGCDAGLADQGGPCSAVGTFGCGPSMASRCVCPTPSPTRFPTPMPTTPFPTAFPTLHPTPFPTVNPTVQPTSNPTPQPTVFPTERPTLFPTRFPTAQPTTPFPTVNPTVRPTMQPTFVGDSPFPTAQPTTTRPTPQPTDQPTWEPTSHPTPQPTPMPSAEPTPRPTDQPTSAPTPFPPGITASPTLSPTPTPPIPPSPMPTLPNYLLSVRLGNTTRVGRELIVTCEDETGALGTTVPSLSETSPCADFLAVCPAAVRTWFQQTVRVVDPGAIIAVVRCGSYDSLVVPSSSGTLEDGLCVYLAEFDCSVGEATAQQTTLATTTSTTVAPTQVDTTTTATATTAAVNATEAPQTEPPGAVGTPGGEEEEGGGGGGVAAAVIIILLLLGCGVAFYILFVRQRRPLPWTGRPLGERAPARTGGASRGGSHVGSTEMSTTAATSPPARPPPTPATPSPAVDSPALLPMASATAYDSESDEETIDIARRKSAKGSKVKSGGSRVKRGTGGSRVGGTGGTPLLTTPVKSAGSGVTLAPRTPAADAAPNTPSSVTPRKPRTAKSPKTPKTGGKGKGGGASRGSTNKRSSGSSGAARVSRKEKVAAEGEGGRISNLLDFVEADE